jgi:hypothetical protein
MAGRACRNETDSWLQSISMTATDLNHRLYDAPFKAFKIHLTDGSSVNVINPGMVLVSESSVIIPIEMGNDSEGYPLVKRWRTVAPAHMVQFADIDEPVSGKRPKGRGRK